MPKLNTILIILLLFQSILNAQNNVDIFNYYYKKGDLTNAFIYGEKIRKTVELNAETNQTIKNAILLDDIAFLYTGKAKYDIAESLYSQSAAIKKKILGENHLDYSSSLNELAIVYAKRGGYSKAEPLFLQSLAIRKKVLGENHIDYARSLHNLASIYEEQGEYSKSEILYIQSLTIIKKKLGENHSDYALCSNSLATLYQKKGEFSKAEQIYLQLLTIYKRKTGENHSKDIILLNNLALLYSGQGLYSKAESLFLELLKISKDVLGENDPGYSRALENMAGFYSNKGEYTKAIQMCLQSLTIKKMKFGENHPDYASSLNNLAGLYVNQADYAKAEPLLLKALIIRKKILGENHIACSSSLNNLAILYQNQGKYKKAESLFLQSLEIKKKVLGENHPDYIFTINNLALFYQLYDVKLNNEKVTGYFQSGFSSFKKQIFDASNYLSENELRFFRLDKFSNRFFPLSFLHSYPSQYLTINIGCYENELLVKNLSLRNQQRIAKSIQKGGDMVLQNKYDEFLHNKRQLGKLNEVPIDQRPAYSAQLATDTETLEKELVRGSSVFSDTKNALSINWKQVQEKLQSNEIAIDLLAYSYYNKKWTDSIVYAAFVVRKGYKAPKYIPLFEEKQLKYLIVRNSKDDDTIQARILNKQYLDKVISDLFLKPLEKELQGISNIYLSPSGFGNQLDFSAFPVSATQTLGEKYQVHILGSTAEIVNYKTTHLDPKAKLELLLYGNIDYNKSEATSIIVNDTLENKSNINFEGLATRSGITKWNYLIGTKKEVEQIQISGQQNGFSTTIINEGKATEETIKELDGKTTPYLLHLATHGFFFPDPKQELPRENLLSDHKSEIFKTAEDPMMRSGLLFAGANKYWGKPAQNLTSDDGILTASEISNLDLSACQLVVMSACETGLGQINGSEGVFGLQRAFKMAGVKNIIMSLWRVPDAQTAELFDIFYNECLSGKTIHKAFQLAQAKMKIKYPPYYWAGFVLLE